MQKKTCIKCGQEKSITHFGKHKKSDDGRDERCKDCVAEWDLSCLRFDMALLALLKLELGQAQQELASAAVHGDQRSIRLQELHLTCLQAQIKHMKPIIIDGSVSHRALPERIERN